MKYEEYISRQNELEAKMSALREEEAEKVRLIHNDYEDECALRKAKVVHYNRRIYELRCEARKAERRFRDSLDSLRRQIKLKRVRVHKEMMELKMNWEKEKEAVSC